MARAAEKHCAEFAKLRVQLNARVATTPPLRGEARFRASQSALKRFVELWGAVTGEPLRFTPVNIPEGAVWGPDGLAFPFYFIGGHFETLFWELGGDLRKLAPDGRLVADPWDFLFRNISDNPAQGRERAKTEFVISNSTPWAADAKAGNLRVGMDRRVPRATDLLKDLVAESLAACGTPLRAATFGEEVRPIPWWVSRDVRVCFLPISV